MNAMEEFHLTIETLINGKRVGIDDLHDPFLRNRTTYEPSILDRLKILWTGRILFEVKVRGDREAHRQWFRTDKIPGDDNEKETSIQTATNGADTDAAKRA